ncbi:MAG: hypothetical protein HKP30_15935 [Myxococcales bacterium]|nr:hypothetical protein [Myxococcales bacterium]
MTTNFYCFDDWDDVRAELAAGPEAWQELDVAQLATLHFLACSETALPGAEPPGLAHQRLFAHLVEQTTPEYRGQILHAYREKLLAESGLIAPLFPFYLFEPEFELAVLAADCIVDLWTHAGNDPLESPRALARIGFAHGDPRVQAVTLASLVDFGDPRLRELWDGRWHAIPREQRYELWQLLGSYETVEAVECLLRWLERGPLVDYGGVAGSLSRLGRNGEPLFQARRDFATPGAAFDAIGTTQEWSVAEYGREIAPRIRALAATEQGPHYVIPWVAESWGVDVADVAPTGAEWVREAG